MRLKFTQVMLLCFQSPVGSSSQTDISELPTAAATADCYCTCSIPAFIILPYPSSLRYCVKEGISL